MKGNYDHGCGRLMEEMGILIADKVGRKVCIPDFDGRCFPSAAIGSATSLCDFNESPMSLIR